MTKWHRPHVMWGGLGIIWNALLICVGEFMCVFLAFFFFVYFVWLICMCEKHDNNKQEFFFPSNLPSLQFRCSCNKTIKSIKVAQIAKPSEHMNSQRSNAEESSLLYDVLNWRYNGIESRKCQADVLSLASFRTVAPQQPQERTNSKSKPLAADDDIYINCYSRKRKNTQHNNATFCTLC